MIDQIEYHLGLKEYDSSQRTEESARMWNFDNLKNILNLLNVH